MSRQTLSDQIKRFIVTSLACYEGPASVAAKVEKEFNVVVTRQAVEKYDPTRRAGCKLSPKWRQLHAVTRATFIANLEDIGVAQRAMRLRLLEKLYDQAEAAGQIALAAQLLAQVAKEVGGMFTNRHCHEVATPPYKPMTLDEFYGGAKEPETVEEAQARWNAALAESNRRYCK
jgi:hypothetical protein